MLYLWLYQSIFGYNPMVNCIVDTYVDGHNRKEQHNSIWKNHYICLKIRLLKFENYSG